jgi:hypothetical protein
MFVRRIYEIEALRATGGLGQLLAQDLVRQLEVAEEGWAELVASPPTDHQTTEAPTLRWLGASIDDHMVQLAGLDPATSSARSCPFRL